MNPLIARAMMAVAASGVLAASTEHVIPRYEKLRTADVRVAVLVPTVVPADGKIYADGTPDSSGGYEVDLGTRPDCTGGACSAGYITGVPTSSHVAPAGYHPVKLTDGGVGYYLNHGCGANCDGSFELLFFRANAKYSIFLNGGPLDQALLIESGLKKLGSH